MHVQRKILQLFKPDRFNDQQGQEIKVNYLTLQPEDFAG
jgi:hypothetical protein